MRNAFVRAVTCLVIGGSVLCLIGACAPYDEHTLYAQEDRLNQAKDTYAATKQRCEQLGGSMTLRAERFREPGYHDYRLAKCVKR